MNDIDENNLKLKKKKKMKRTDGSFSFISISMFRIVSTQYCVLVLVYRKLIVGFKG